jgi:hypothetical protein
VRLEAEKRVAEREISAEGTTADTADENTPQER